MLGIGAGVLASPYISGTAVAADTDVVVIGAGAAGISTARQLRNKGLEVTVVEAAGRIGGRVHTDNDVFGVPYDMGAHWLHYREANPFVDYGEDNGFALYAAPDDDVLQVGNRIATDSEREAFDDAVETAYRAISRAGSRGRDVAPSSVVPELGEWHPSAHLATGPYEMAKDFDHFSCADWYSAEGGTDYFCREGFGTLFAHSARDVPVTLNTTVQRIKWGGNGVQIETEQGTLSAKAVVVTVSTGVLAAGGVVFDPPLPEKTEAAFHDVTMGHYTHVALQLSENFFGIGEDGYFYYKIDKETNGSPEGFAALVDASGTGISYCDLGGDFARQMADAGDAATLDFVLAELRRMFGSNVDKALVGSHVADWTNNPLTLGAYASAEPGGAGARSILRQEIADRIWFAGEAMSTDDWATVAGAHKSGLQVAASVSNALRA